MHTNPSATNPMDGSISQYQHFSHLPSAALSHGSPALPAQAVRTNPSYPSNDNTALRNTTLVTSPTSLKETGTAFGRPARSSSIVFSPPFNSGAIPPSQHFQPLGTSTASVGDPHIDGSEPRMFPGVVNRRRTGSIHWPSSVAMSERDPDGSKVSGLSSLQTIKTEGGDDKFDGVRERPATSAG